MDRSRKSKNFVYFAILNLVIFCFLFGLLEVGARLFFKNEDMLEQILDILEEHRRVSTDFIRDKILRTFYC